MLDANMDLLEAAMNGDVPSAIRALSRNAMVDFVNVHGMSPLIICSGGVGPVELMELLIEKGANVHQTDKEGWTPLIYVSSSGQLPLIRTLIKAGADVNHLSLDKKWTPLTRASFRGHMNAVEILVDSGARVDFKSGGMTPKEWAVKSDHIDIVKFFENLENNSCDK